MQRSGAAPRTPAEHKKEIRETPTGRSTGAGLLPDAGSVRTRTQGLSPRAAALQRRLAFARAGVDLLTAAAAVALTGLWVHGTHFDAGAAVMLGSFPLLAVSVMHLRGLYKPRLRLTVLDEVPTVVGTLSIAAMLEIALALPAHGESHSAMVVRAWVLAAIFVPLGRAFVASTQRRRRLRDGPGRPALIVGAGVVGSHVARRLLSRPEYGLRPVGFLDVDPPEHLTKRGRPAPLLGSPEDIEAVAARTGATTVIVAFSSESDRQRVPLVRSCQRLGLDVMVVPRLFDTFNQRAQLQHLGGLPLLTLRRADPRGWEFAIKHALDSVGAAVLLVILSPLMLLLALGVKMSSPGPLLFRQRRVGRDCQPFDLLKFRSMRLDDVNSPSFRPGAGSAPGGVEGTDRRTRFGRFIRRTSLDELPQLINVLRGDMSLVGPRPERPEFVEIFEGEVERYGDRHRVKAGITGWAQVHGLRGQTSIADRAEWDNYYIENWSLRLDLIVLALTARALLARQED